MDFPNLVIQMSIFLILGLCCWWYLFFFIIIGLFIENNFRTVETPDKMPRSVASDLDLHSLHLSHKKATNLMSLLLDIGLTKNRND